MEIEDILENNQKKRAIDILSKINCDKEIIACDYLAELGAFKEIENQKINRSQSKFIQFAEMRNHLLPFLQNCPFCFQLLNIHSYGQAS